MAKFEATSRLRHSGVRVSQQPISRYGSLGAYLVAAQCSFFGLSYYLVTLFVLFA